MKSKIIIFLIACLLILSSCNFNAGSSDTSSDILDNLFQNGNGTQGNTEGIIGGNYPSDTSGTQSQPQDETESSSGGGTSSVVLDFSNNSQVIEFDTPSGDQNQTGNTPGSSGGTGSGNTPDSSVKPLNILINSVEKYSGASEAKSSSVKTAISKYFSGSFSVYRYYYSKLDSAQKVIYDEIDRQVKQGNQTANTSFSGDFNAYFENNIWPAYYSYILDNTWAFFLPMEISVEGSSSEMTIKFPYIYSDSQIINTFAKINAFITQAQSNLSSSMSDYEKELSLYNFVCHSMEYSRSNPTDAYNLTGAVNGQGVCEAYSEMLKLLFDSVGLKSLTVIGYSKENNEGHKWNIVCIDGQYTHVDATYGDTSTSNGGKTKYISNLDNSKDAVLNYSYFNMNDSFLFSINSLTESESSFTFPALPACNANLSFYDYYGCNVNSKQDAENYIMRVAQQVSTKGKTYFYIKSNSLSHNDIANVLNKYVSIKSYSYVGIEIQKGSLVEIQLP